jgi:hypothetical protein
MATAATIASLRVNLSAGTAQFAAGMKQAAGMLKKFGSDTANISRGISQLRTIFAAFIAGELVSFVNRSIEGVAATKDLASQLGVTTDALTQLRYAAEVNGSSSAAMDDALQKMNKSLGGISEEGGKTADVVAGLGLSIQSLQSMTPDKAFMSLADAIGSINNPMEQAAAATAIFGKGAGNIINVLKLGSSGIQEFRDAADRLGITLSQINAEKIAAAGDQVKSLSMMLDGMKNLLIAELAPVLGHLVQMFIDWSSEGQRSSNILMGGLSAIGQGFAHVANVIKVFQIGWKALQGIATAACMAIIQLLDSVGEAFVTLANKIPGVNISWTNLLKDMKSALNESGQALTGEMKQLWEEVGNDTAGKEVRRAFAEIQAAANAAAEAAVAARPKFEVMGNTFSKVAEEAEKFQDAMMKRGESVFESVQTPLEKYNATLEDLESLLAHNAISFETYHRAIAKSNDELAEHQKIKSVDFKSIAAREFRFTKGVPGNLGSASPTAMLERKADTQAQLARENNALTRQSNDLLRASIGNTEIIDIN